MYGTKENVDLHQRPFKLFSRSGSGRTRLTHSNFNMKSLVIDNSSVYSTYNPTDGRTLSESSGTFGTASNNQQFLGVLCPEYSVQGCFQDMLT